jgi:hypothetical protein
VVECLRVQRIDLHVLELAAPGVHDRHVETSRAIGRRQR